MSTLKVDSIVDGGGSGAPTAPNGLTVGDISMPTTGPLSNRNLIINGAMRIHQRSGTIAVTSSSAYTLDRFEAVLGGSYTVGVDVTQDSDGPDGFTNCLKVDVTSTSTPATSNNFMIAYHPESQDLVHLNWGSSNGKYLTLSFWVKSNKTGTYGFSILHHGKTRSWLSSYAISSADTWEYKTILIDPDTSAAFDDDNQMSLRLLWHLSDGPDDLEAAHPWQTYGGYESITGQVNLCDSTSNYFQITGVQLEVGDTATPFEHRSFGAELALCQRYYQKSFPQGTTPHGNDLDGIYRQCEPFNSGSIAGVGNEFCVEMRSTPTMTMWTTNASANASSGRVTFYDGAWKNDVITIHNSTCSTNFGIGGNFTSGTKLVQYNYEAEAEL